MATRPPDPWGSPTLQQSQGQNAMAPAPPPPLSILQQFQLGDQRADSEVDWGYNEARWGGATLGEMQDLLRTRGYNFGSLSTEDLAWQDRHDQGNPSNSGEVRPGQIANARAFWLAWRAERLRDPSFGSGFGDVYDYASLGAHAERRRAEQNASIEAQAPDGLGLPGFIGDVVGRARRLDPLFLIPGAGPEVAGGEAVARGVLGQVVRNVVRSGVTNAEVAAVTEPFVRVDAAHLGQDRTIADTAYDVAAAFVGGAAIHGGMEAGAAGARGVARGVSAGLDFVTPDVGPAFDFSNVMPSTNREMADRFAELVPHPTPDQQAAANVVGRAGVTTDSSPFTPGPVGDTVHAQTLDDHQAEIGNGSPRPSAPPRLVSRADAALGNAGTRSDAIAQFKARVHHAETSAGTGVGHDYNAESHAMGPYQFLASTWNHYFRRRYPGDPRSDVQIAALRRDPHLNEVLMDDLVADNVATLRRAGYPVTAGNLYLLHAAGPGAGPALLRAAPGARAIDVYREALTRSLGPARAARIAESALRGNPWLRGTAGEAVNWAHARMEGRAPAPIAVAEGATPEAPAGDYSPGEAEMLRGEAEAAEMERLGAAHEEHAAGGAEPHEAPDLPPRRTFDDRPVLRPEQFDSPEEHAREQVLYDGMRDDQDGFAVVQEPVEAALRDTRENSTQGAGNGAPGREAAASGAEGQAAETAPEAPVVFHGTNHAFDAPDFERSGGFHFVTEDEAAAERYSRSRGGGRANGKGAPRVVRYQLPRAPHLLDLDSEEGRAAVASLNPEPNGKASAIVSAARNGGDVSQAFWLNTKNLGQQSVEGRGAFAADLANPLRDLGYDGIRFKDADHSSVGLFDRGLQDRPPVPDIEPLDQSSVERFSAPDGEGAKAQSDSLEHDIRMMDPETAGSFRLAEDEKPQPLAEILEDIDADRRAAAELRACMAPAGVAG